MTEVVILTLSAAALGCWLLTLRRKSQNGRRQPR
ncbi:hypothetical protein SAMN05444390_103503 [Marinobacterium lutimaris]|uniref:Uncharacterized protein n=1 Tax=Marinobacterium lutimaris TaxID=568106 RepID=A0A1H6CH08_9GAMM|nr:hypothetical protein SAMN05444390_103503 [Marinobacterium lutimaris]